VSASAIRAKVIDDGHGLRVAIVVTGREQATAHVLSVGEAIKLRDELGEAIDRVTRGGSANPHPDGCHTTDVTALRDCASDGHHECSSCARKIGGGS
jgi:transposase